MASNRKSKAELEREKVIQNRLQELLTRMLQDEDNKYCVDCDAKGPRWASWNIGIFVCIRCAGIHRNLGVHISKVKSVNLDSWTPHQTACMQIMGNSKARAVYEANVPEGFRRPQADSPLDVFIRAKYEKKKYIAREWIPTKAPELPEGWSALIEAEKAKKDIRSIVLPSHTNTNDDIVKRERQSPKEMTKKTNSTVTITTSVAASKSEKLVKTTQSSATTVSTTASATAAKPASIESNFDLLSLSTVPTKTAIANDLLGLGAGNGDNSSEFDDFVGAQNPSTTTTPKPDEGSKTNGNQNGGNGNSHTNFFDDFDIVQTGNGSADNGQADPATQKQTMSKDSIMALFNQKPTGSAAQSADAISGGRQLPVNQKQFEFPANLNMGNTSVPAGMQLPPNYGGGIGANLGGNAGLLAGFGGSQPPKPQFQQPVGGPGVGGMMNNPFLAMGQPSRSDQNNVFGGFSTTAPAANKNFLQ